MHVIFLYHGSGKTSIVYGAYAYLKNLPKDNLKKIDRILVIGPLNSFGPWEDEFESCFGRKPDSKRIVGMDKKTRVEYLQGIHQSELTLMSYITATNSINDVIAFLKNNNFLTPKFFTLCNFK